jgi:hypothetical protein
MTQGATISLGDLAAIVTALVAIGGLALSIYNFFLARADKQVRLTAKLANGFLPMGPELGDLMLILEVANPGEKPATITSVGLKWRDKSIAFIRGIQGTRQIPFELEPGKNATFWTAAREMATTLKEEGARGKVPLRSQFTTAIGTEHVSKKFKLDGDEWAR